MDWLLQFFREVAWLFNETAFFLLIGFGLAGILKYTVSESRAFRYFKGNDLKSVTAASIVGVPLPLCSCSVLPVAASMRKQGASRGATASFLISTPETGVDSIATSYALLDPILTVVRPVAAFLTAVVTGQAVNWFVPAETEEEKKAQAEASEPVKECCDHDHDHDHDHSNEKEDAGGVRGMVRYSFVTLLDELGPYLILGFLLSGVIGVLVPSEWFENPLLSGVGGMLLMLGIGIPMYVCATGSTPVAAALLMKGLNPGAAVVFLLAGPATNIGALVALRKYLGQRTVLIYLICIAVMSLAIGFIVDAIYVSQGITAAAIVGQGASFIPESVKIASSILMVMMMVPSAIRTRFHRAWAENIRRWCRPIGFDPVSKAAMRLYALLLIVAYLSTAVSSVRPGETAWVLTFGKVGRTVSEPGAVVHLPWPIQSVKTESRSSVRRVTIGTVEALGERSETTAGERVPQQWFSSSERKAQEEAEILAADANLLVARMSVHYSVTDPYRFAFRVTDADALVRRNAEWAVRRVSSTMTTDSLLVGNQSTIESRVAEIVQGELDDLDTGIRVEGARVLFVHAPERVHQAFRDIASAEESRLTEHHIAERQRTEIEQQALSEAYRLEREAEEDAADTLASEAGWADGFTARAEAWRETEEITRMRLFFDALEAFLARVPLAINLTDREAVIEIWVDEREDDSDWIDLEGEGVPARRGTMLDRKKPGGQ